MDPCKFGSHHDVSSFICATSRSLGADETLKEHEGDGPATHLSAYNDGINHLHA